DLRDLDRVIQVCLARRALLPLVRPLTETVGTHDHVHVEPVGVRLDGLAQARRQGVEPGLVGKDLCWTGHQCFYSVRSRRFTIPAELRGCARRRGHPTPRGGAALRPPGPARRGRPGQRCLPSSAILRGGWSPPIWRSPARRFHRAGGTERAAPSSPPAALPNL